MMSDLNKLKERIIKNESDRVKLNRILLFIGMMIFVVVFIIIGIQTLTDSISSEPITLYYADKNYRHLVSEKLILNSHIPQKEKIHYVISMLVQGPKNAQSRALIPMRTKLEAVWLLENHLHIHFSDEFIDSPITLIRDERLIGHSILSTLFESFSEVSSISIHVGNTYLKTIFGGHMYHTVYHRNSYRIASLYED